MAANKTLLLIRLIKAITINDDLDETLNSTNGGTEQESAEDEDSDEEKIYIPLE